MRLLGSFVVMLPCFCLLQVISKPFIVVSSTCRVRLSGVPLTEFQICIIPYICRWNFLLSACLLSGTFLYLVIIILLKGSSDRPEKKKKKKNSRCICQVLSLSSLWNRLWDEDLSTTGCIRRYKKLEEWRIWL